MLLVCGGVWLDEVKIGERMSYFGELVTEHIADNELDLFADWLVMIMQEKYKGPVCFDEVLLAVEKDKKLYDQFYEWAVERATNRLSEPPERGED